MAINKDRIDYLLSQQDGFVLRKIESDKKLSSEILISLGVKQDSEFYQTYTEYFLGIVLHREGASDMVDPCPPQGFEAAMMAHEYWGVPKNYILFTTGEGEGGYLYNTEDNSVWDFYLGKHDLLGTDKLTHWNSFYEFMEWYLTVDE